MNPKQQNHISKFLSLILRHKPETIGLSLDENGWAGVDELLQKLGTHGQPLSLTELREIVANDEKSRYSFSPDLQKIRANQGHSISVDLELKEKIPPVILYHGTASRNIDSIKEKGLVKGSRNHVHLSVDTQTALKVGMRYGKPVILTIKALEMYQAGFKFYISENGVWLTDTVPQHFIEFNF
jgi:putative RNA 2'-phosphotransferase